MRPARAVPTAWPTTVSPTRIGTCSSGTSCSEAMSGKYSSYVVKPTSTAAISTARRTGTEPPASRTPARSIAG